MGSTIRTVGGFGGAVRLVCDPGPAASVRHRPQGRRSPLTRARSESPQAGDRAAAAPGSAPSQAGADPEPLPPPWPRTSALPGPVPSTPRGPRTPGPRCHLPQAAGKARRVLQLLSRFGKRGGRGCRAWDSGGYRGHVPQPRPRGPGLPDADHGALKGCPQVPRCGQLPAVPPGSVRSVPQHPAPARGAKTAADRWAVRGLLSTALSRPAPCPRAAERSALRAAPAAAGYSSFCATYKSSLCGAILSLLVCGSRVGPAPRAESEGRRRRRKVRGAASVLAEPPPQVEDGRTPATEGACSPEVLGRSFPYPSGAAPASSRSQTSSQARGPGGGLGAGLGAAGRPGVGSGGLR